MKIRSLIATCAAATFLTSGVTACSSNQAGYYDTICVDPNTQIRMPDYYCASGAYYHPGWVYYVPYGYHAPAYGIHVTHYDLHRYSRPTNATIHIGGIPSTGGNASRYSTGNVSVSKNGSVSKTKPGSGSGNTGSRPKSRSGGSGSSRSGRK